MFTTLTGGTPRGARPAWVSLGYTDRYKCNRKPGVAVRLDRARIRGVIVANQASDSPLLRLVPYYAMKPRKTGRDGDSGHIIDASWASHCERGPGHT